MLNTRFNTANVAALGPILTTLLVGLDVRFGWGMGDVWMTAFAAFVMWLLTSITPDAGYTYRAPSQNFKVVVWLPLAITALLILQGCSAFVPYYGQFKAIADTGISTAIEDRKDFNDKKLALSLVTICDASVGAVYRLETAEVRDIIIRLCGGSPAITADQLARLAALFDAAQNNKLELPIPPTTPLEGDQP